MTDGLDLGFDCLKSKKYYVRIRQRHKIVNFRIVKDVTENEDVRFPMHQFNFEWGQFQKRMILLIKAEKFRRFFFCLQKKISNLKF